MDNIADVLSNNITESITQIRRIIVALTKGALALPEALVAIAELSEKLASMGKQLDKINSSIDLAASRIDQAADGMKTSANSVRDIIDLVSGSVPELAKSALSLGDLVERLGTLGLELTTELPKTTSVIRGLSPELSRIMGNLDDRLDHLDGVVSDLSRTIVTILGSIPGFRKTLRGQDRTRKELTPGT